MAVYFVEHNAAGDAAWFATWWMVPGYVSRHTVRPAVEDEIELMDKVVWQIDTPDDVKRLRELIARKHP